MTKILANLYDFECHIFRSVNRHFDHKFLNFYFRNITHLGGATFTIASVLIFFVLSSSQTKYVGLASGLSLLISHLPVVFVKKIYPRRRPYLALQETKVTVNPLKDHSFPSGHTTAIFSIVIPLFLWMPILGLLLLPIAISVGLSRIYLGLHYPSDVLVGSILGTLTGLASFAFIEHKLMNFLIL
ncbi:phosphatase PAP2 family protein [Bacillus salitolerans]|uniref:Phosphatase PAP2 family protein n=1 Tax=Bacillus salitolerans TaxID=1437434 RepID=A0ABW4LXV5_9BACI